MMKLMLFEFKKMIRMKTVLYFFLLSIIFIAAIFLRNVVQQDMIPLKKTEYFSGFSSEVSMQNSADRHELEKVDDIVLREKLQVGENLHGLLRELRQVIEDGEWQKELTIENEVYQTAMAYQEMEGQFSLSQLDMNDMIRINNVLQKEALPKEDADLSIQQAVFMKKMVALLYSPIGFLILLFVVGSLITKEFEEHNTQLIYTLPIPKWKYFLTKFGSIFVVGLLWIALVTLFSYVIPIVFQQSQENVFAYPLLTGEGDLANVGDYLIDAIILAVGSLLFGVSLIVCIGFFLRNTILTYVVVFIMFIGGWMVASNGFMHFANPFTYQQVDRVLISYPMHYPKALAVLTISTLILLWITISGNRKRGI